MRTYSVKNWSKFQHFKDRKPPWVKLYRDILDDIQWHELDPEAAKSLVMLWLIASEDDGYLPDDKKLAFRLRISEKQIKSIISKLSHWLEHCDISTISDGYLNDPLETETETETEKRERKRAVAYASSPRGSRLSPDWKPTDELIQWAMTERPGFDWQRETENFRDYWLAKPGKDGCKLDWPRTWKKWIRTSRGYQNGRGDQAARIQQALERIG